MSPPKSPATTDGPPPALTEVRYSLPQMLKEVEIERAAASFAMEKLDQAEIGKLFKTQTPRRRVKSKK
jgi:hypothetical protein